MTHDTYRDLHVKHRAIGGPLDGDPIYTDWLPCCGAELIHDTDVCEHVYRFDGRVWRHERAVVLSQKVRKQHDEGCEGSK